MLRDKFIKLCTSIGRHTIAQTMHQAGKVTDDDSSAQTGTHWTSLMPRHTPKSAFTVLPSCRLDRLLDTAVAWEAIAMESLLRI